MMDSLIIILQSCTISMTTLMFFGQMYIFREISSEVPEIYHFSKAKVLVGIFMIVQMLAVTFLSSRLAGHYNNHWILLIGLIANILPLLFLILSMVTDLGVVRNNVKQLAAKQNNPDNIQ